MIDGIGHHLMLMVPHRPGRPQPKDALRNLLTSTDRTLEALGGDENQNAIHFLPPALLEALNYRPAALQRLHNQLRILRAAATSAKIKTRRGGKEKPREREIAREVAVFFYMLTGEKPTVSVRHTDGEPTPFLALLSKVFNILEIEASAASQGRVVQRQWKKKNF